MVVLIDTNVIIDYLITREPFYKAASAIIIKCAQKEITGYIAFHSIFCGKCQRINGANG